MPSPNIPSWPVPARPLTGGKQPGKVPKAPSVMGETSDDSSSSGDDSDDPSSDIESDAPMHSDIDINTQGRKGVGYGLVLIIDALFKPTHTVLNNASSPSPNLVWMLVAKLLVGGTQPRNL